MTKCKRDGCDNPWDVNAGSTTCAVHRALVSLGVAVDRVDRVAAEAGISVSCLVREAVAKTLDALDRREQG